MEKCKCCIQWVFPPFITVNTNVTKFISKINLLNCSTNIIFYEKQVNELNLLEQQNSGEIYDHKWVLKYEFYKQNIFFEKFLAVYSTCLKCYYDKDYIGSVHIMNEFLDNLHLIYELQHFPILVEAHLLIVECLYLLPSPNLKRATHLLSRIINSNELPTRLRLLYKLKSLVVAKMIYNNN